MPLILEACNHGMAVVNFLVPDQHRAQWDGWVHTLMAHPDLPELSQLFPLFDGIFHLAADDQNKKYKV